MSNQFTPIVKPDGITINLNRGMKGMCAGIVKLLPDGQAALNGGLRQVIDRVIDENLQVVDRDFTAMDLAEHLGILKKSGGGDREHFRRKRTGDRRRRA